MSSSPLECSRCSKIVEGRAIQAVNKHYHLACFVCDYCQTQLGPPVPFYPRYGRFYCKNCEQSLFGEYCKACGQVISADGTPSLQALGSFWHQEHFVCTSCSAPLGDGFVNKRDQPYCRTCASGVSSH
eukprot:TRINITY_DN7158_c0_g1_i1.p1 TRINITY_DN7158_c0_g1~~TRINITY_DN7158_c0_g1_i1.p1  ORF type:complete len:128 (-),score=21.09 TRINITY_DN7158_c0_g1_i1:70-453(-)